MHDCCHYDEGHADGYEQAVTEGQKRPAAAVVAEAVRMFAGGCDARLDFERGDLVREVADEIERDATVASWCAKREGAPAFV